MQLTWKPYNLELTYPFTVSGFSRTFTPLVLTEIKYENHIGYGEASMPPYLGESQESVLDFLSKVDLSHFDSPVNVSEIMSYVDSIDIKNTAAKTAVDIALHDLIGKIKNQPCYEYFGVDKNKMPLTSLTIGIDKPEIISRKVKEAEEFKILKVKLGSQHDKLIIETIRVLTDKPLYIDANQGWKDKEHAIEMIEWLSDKNVIMIEQPMPKELLEEAAWLKGRSSMPLFADEACQRLSDLESLKDIYDGINIKLMKCTGLNEARKMIDKARSLKMKVMMGCMSETSCAISAAATLAPLCDYCDLDGPWMVTNNPFENPELIDGRIVLSDKPGLGIELSANSHKLFE
jgi:L-Ala-D/L-Glu epimerase